MGRNRDGDRTIGSEVVKCDRCGQRITGNAHGTGRDPVTGAAGEVWGGCCDRPLEAVR